MNPVIEVKNVRRSFRSPKKKEGLAGAWKLLFSPEYQDHEALKGVSLSIEPGAFIGLIGANGAGKTTLLKILSGLIPPTSGEARVLGLEPFKRTLDFRRKISLVMGQKAQLWWDLPAVDAFDLIRAIYEIPVPLYKERLQTLSELLDVTKLLNTQIRRLSLGERMKMELIGALLHWPNVIFLDEPTIGLDVVAAQKLREFLREFNRREKATIILTSHNMEDIERLCSRVLILRAGELIYDGPPGKLTGDGVVELRVRLKETVEIAQLATLVGIPEASVRKAEAGGAEEEGDAALGVFHLSMAKERIVPSLQKLMSAYTVIDMGVSEQSLEGVIQKLFAEKP